MPLAVKSLPNADTEASEDAILTTEARLTQFVRDEIDRALHDIDRRKRLAEAELEQRARRASKRIVSSGHRLELSLRGAPLPILPVTIGAAIIASAWLFSRRT